MTPWLGLTIVLCILSTASTHAPPCGSDESLDATSNTCTCNLTVYTSQESPPTPIVQCLYGQMKIYEDKCQLEKSGFNSDNLHLRDPTCIGTDVINGIARVVVATNTTSTLCGNTLTVNGTHATYSNQLLIPTRVSQSGIISKHNYTYNVSCSYSFIISVALSTALKPVVGAIDIPLPGGAYTVIAMMAAFTDSAFSVPYTESTVMYVENPLYVSVIIPDLDAASFSLVVARLYATGVKDPKATPQYNIITNGCPSAGLGELLTIRNNGNSSEARFEMKVFKITNSNYLYLFADLIICRGQCIPFCKGVLAGRMGNSEDSSTGQVGTGPFEGMKSDPTSGASDRFSWIWTVNSLLLSLLGLRLL
ncbi:pancreatic secretory granule membrane major glycoprotein GP2-like isoform X2 [Ambystoma mexicanum]|uniref:pancreatic secretory granule membrane major glycoprotein GP2-like isoform X2 n=1 Tax=Ambystoma mexicanum TaxID=8296 RepID=UPI0037E9207A